MKTEIFDFSGYQGCKLPAYLFLPETDVTAVLQITHGMTEHMGRYQDFAQYLCARGIAVSGFDLRGHGKHSGDQAVASFGEGGWAASVQDMHQFHLYLNNR